MHAAYLALASLPLLTGCATLGDWWSGPPAAAVQAAPAPMPEQEYRRVSQELALLREQQADVAAALPRAQDSATRTHHVRHINSLSERIELLQSRLRAAGRSDS